MVKILSTRTNPKTGRHIHRIECPKCGGDGIIATDCKTCGSTGKQTSPLVFDQHKGIVSGGEPIDCWQCKGDGKTRVPCNTCRGEGSYFIFE